MKYVRKAKNTPLKGKLPDDFITEVVDEVLFNSKHEALGGWEKVSNANCKKLLGHNDLLMEAFRNQRDLERRRQFIESKPDREKQRQLEEEFEAFKAWKDSKL